MKNLIVTFILVLSFFCQAGIIYDEEKKSIKVTDFPATFPCTLKRLYTVNKNMGWEKVTYDKAAETYTVSCDLLIGANDGSETYFQIGTKKAPEEILIMKGNLAVSPFWIKGENKGDSWKKAEKKVNRLTLGEANDKSVKTALKFLCQKNDEFTLYVGCYPQSGKKLVVGYGGQLFVYNSIITSAIQTPGKLMKGMSLCGNGIVLDNAELSWMTGNMTYGMCLTNSMVKYKVTGSTFSHGGAAVLGGKQEISNCTITDFEQALLDWGSMDALLTNCALKNNKHNWNLRFSSKGIVCIDCIYDTPSKGDLYRSWVNKRNNKKQYPYFTSKRHIIIEVTDSNGKPVSNAKIRIESEQGLYENMLNYKQVTDQHGRTPEKDSEKAIMLTQVTKKATDTPNKPEIIEYSYKIYVQAEGFTKTTVSDFKPTESWQIKKITLGK